MKHHETTNQTKSPTLPLGRQLHFAKLLRHKSRHIMKHFFHPSPGCSFRPRYWGGCHCDPSPPGKRRTSAAAPPPRCGLPRPPSAAASDLGRPGTGGRTRWIESLCSRNLGNPLGVLKGFCPTIQYSFKRVPSAR